MKILDSLFSSGDFMPHGYCYLWKPGLVWLHVVSDALIALAYFSIPITLIYFIRKRRDLPFNWMFLCVWNVHHGLWHHARHGSVDTLAWYVLALWCDQSCHCYGSVPTAILLVHLVPRALALPARKQ